MPHNSLLVGIGGAGTNVLYNLIACRYLPIQALSINITENTKNKYDYFDAVIINLQEHETIDFSSLSTKNGNSLSQIISGHDVVFIVSGLGGVTGSSIAPKFTNFLKIKKIFTVGVFIFPFSFEGTKRMNIALDSIENIYSYIDVAFTLHNDNLLKYTYRHNSFASKLCKTNDIIYNFINSSLSLDTELFKKIIMDTSFINIKQFIHSMDILNEFR